MSCGRDNERKGGGKDEEEKRRNGKRVGREGREGAGLTEVCQIPTVLPTPNTCTPTATKGWREMEVVIV